MSYNNRGENRGEEKVFSVNENNSKLFSSYPTKEELKLLKLRHDDPESYIREVSKYRKKKRNQKSLLKGVGIGAASGSVIIPSSIYLFDPSSRHLFDTPVDTAISTATSAALGSIAGGVAGGIKEIYDKAKYGSKRKTKKEMKEIALENRLKNEDPQKYKRVKSEQKDVIRVAEGDMTEKDFKEKYGHKPKTKVYSVTMTENELKLFSEFLEQREFDAYYSPDLNRAINGYDSEHHVTYVDSKGNISEFDKAMIGARGNAVGGMNVAGGLETAGGEISQGISDAGNSIGYGVKDGLDNMSKGIKTGATALGAGIAAAGIAGAYSRIKAAKIQAKRNKEKAEEKYKTSNESDFNLEKKAEENDRRLKKKDPKEYKRVKSERKDVLKVIDGKMSENKFKEKYGHKPEII